MYLAVPFNFYCFKESLYRGVKREDMCYFKWIGNVKNDRLIFIVALKPLWKTTFQNEAN